MLLGRCLLGEKPGLVMLRLSCMQWVQECDLCGTIVIMSFRTTQDHGDSTGTHAKAVQRASDEDRKYILGHLRRDAKPR